MSRLQRFSLSAASLPQAVVTAVRKLACPYPTATLVACNDDRCTSLNTASMPYWIVPEVRFDPLDATVHGR